MSPFILFMIIESKMCLNFKSLLLICSIFCSTASFSQVCDTTDKREMVEKLDCYCDPDDRSHVQLELENLGSLSKSFGVEDPKDCASAVTVLFMSHPGQKKFESKVSKKLEQLSYSPEQERGIIGSAEKNAVLINLIQSQACNSTFGTLTIGPFSFGGKSKPAECKDLESLNQKEQLRLAYIGMRVQFAKLSKQSLFDYQLEKLTKAEELTASYPINRIESCLNLSSELKIVKQCLDLNADDTKIINCKSLLLSDSGSIKCLSKEVPQATFQGCKSLLLSELFTLSCLDAKPILDSATACKSLLLSDENTMSCLGISPQSSRASACKSLLLSDAGTLSCLSIEVDFNIVNACKKLLLSEPNTLKCLESKSGPERIRECGQKLLPGPQTLECIMK